MIFLCCNQNSTVIMCMTELLDLMCFHEQFTIALNIGCQINIEGLGIGDVEYFSVVGEIKSDYIFGMFFDNFGWLEAPYCLFV